MNSELVMVVDDDDDLREGIVEILENDGYRTIACETAEAALYKIKENLPRVIVLDNMMPGMGGMALVPLLKREYPGVKIIMITAFSTVDNAVNAMKTGVDDYLAKPFRRDDLLMAVRRMLEAAKFEKGGGDPNMDEALACLANSIRRQILTLLVEHGEMRFMDITRSLGIADHTKVGFHLKNLKAMALIDQSREKSYRLTPQGKKMYDCLHLLAKQISS
jgi:DNA-binding NtrC family response regulator